MFNNQAVVFTVTDAESHCKASEAFLNIQNLRLEAVLIWQLSPCAIKQCSVIWVQCARLTPQRELEKRLRQCRRQHRQWRSNNLKTVHVG